MIVVFMHQCAMSTSVPGNGSDLGIRRAWLPLFDRYEVDLVLSGHEHDYERSYPVRGYDAGAHGTVVSPNPDQTKGETVDTRRPHVATTETGHRRRRSRPGTPRQGTVFLVLGGGGTNGPSNIYGTTPPTACPRPRSSPSATPSPARRRPASPATRPTRSRTRPGRRPPTPATPTATRSSTSTPASGRGETTITMQYFAIPAVSNEAGPAHDGTTTLPTTPFETFVFGRKVKH